jgi:hypothetical protein
MPNLCAAGDPSVPSAISNGAYRLLQRYFVEVEDDTGYDAVAEVIARAMKNLARGTVTSALAAAIEARDLLGDLADVPGTERVKVRDAVALLRDLAPGWGRYRRAQQKRTGRPGTRRQQRGALGARKPPAAPHTRLLGKCTAQECPRPLYVAFREGQQACPLPHQG